MAEMLHTIEITPDDICLAMQEPELAAEILESLAVVYRPEPDDIAACIDEQKLLGTIDYFRRLLEAMENTAAASAD